MSDEELANYVEFLKSNGGVFIMGLTLSQKIIQKHLLHGEMKAGENQSALIRR